MKKLILPNEEEIYYNDKLIALFGYNEIFIDNEYLKHKSGVKEGVGIFDVGANIGFFSSFISKQIPDLYLT